MSISIIEGKRIAFGSCIGYSVELFVVGFAFACLVGLLQGLDLDRALAFVEFLRCLIMISLA
jgi:hypothetical protein